MRRVIIWGLGRVYNAYYQRIYGEIIQEATGFGISRDRLIRIDVLSLPDFNFSDYVLLREKPVSIISRNCFGGIFYHSLDLKFHSPTINLFFSANDFIKLCSDLSGYMKEKLVFDHTAYNSVNNIYYPVMKLGDITVCFNHYQTIEEATQKWNERKQLIDYDNLLAVTYAETPEELEGFDKIPFRRICFTSFLSAMDGTFYLPQETEKLIRHMLNETASLGWSIINPISMMLGKNNFMRCEYKIP